jgi:hypothetical protein
MKKLSTVIKIGSLFLLLILPLAACSQASDSPKDIVQAAAQAFVAGYDGRDLSKFDTFFASPGQSGNSEGLVLVQAAAHNLVDQAQPDQTFELRSFSL